MSRQAFSDEDQVHTLTRLLTSHTLVMSRKVDGNHFA